MLLDETTENSKDSYQEMYNYSKLKIWLKSPTVLRNPNLQIRNNGTRRWSFERIPTYTLSKSHYLLFF
ncbi:MAG TPA: hypothetical protein DDY13_07655 [Cytophagales bacterium]|jgi:hypothetical protein|nr:hypothetical protein [Cytophagales bacterium]